MSDEDLILVLRYINAVRYRRGLKLLAEIPKGVDPDSLEEIGRSCPIAKAIPNTVIALEYARTPDWQTAVAMSRAFGKSSQGYVEFPGEFVVDLPPVLMDFIARYEYNLLPEFVEQS